MKTKLVTIATCHYYKALLLKSMLEAERIESYLANVNLIQSDIAAGVNLLVKDSDVKKAIQITHLVDKEYSDDEKQMGKKLEHYNKIICPVDFSDDSKNAAKFAVLLAAKIKAEVKLIHAFNPIQPLANVFPDAFSYQVDMSNIYEDELYLAKQKMQKFKESIILFMKEHSKLKIRLSNHLIANDPFNGIPSYCKKFNSAIIVMGTKGLGKSKSYIAGSVALNTIEKTNIPVLVVPMKYDFSSLESFNIIYLTDFDEKDSSSFRKLLSITDVFNPEIHCVHIEHKKNKINQILLDELVDELKTIYSQYKIDCSLINSKDAAKSINTFIKTKKINLLAMSERKRSFLFSFFSKSILKDLLFNINIPLLIFKVQD